MKLAVHKETECQLSLIMKYLHRQGQLGERHQCTAVIWQQSDHWWWCKLL